MNSVNKREIVEKDLEILNKKIQQHGYDWKKRGGVGAFILAARKWDRIERFCCQQSPDKWNIFKAAENKKVTKDLFENIGDLRRYLILIEEEILYRQHKEEKEEEEEEEEEDQIVIKRP